MLSVKAKNSFATLVPLQFELPKLTGPTPPPVFPDLTDSAPPLELRKPEMASSRHLRICRDLSAKTTDSAPPLELPSEDVPMQSPGMDSTTGNFPEYFNDSAPPLCTDKDVFDWLKVRQARQTFPCITWSNIAKTLFQCHQ